MKFFIIVAFLSVYLFGDTEAMESTERLHKKLADIQVEIDKLDKREREALANYELYQQKIEFLKLKNSELERVLEAQNIAVSELENNIIEIEQIEVKIPNLMKEMVFLLKKSIDSDTPFHLEKREKRVSSFEKSLDNPTLKVAKKFQNLINIYVEEMKYSYSAEVYRGKIADKIVNFLRVGRLALYYNELQSNNFFTFDRGSREWIKLPQEFSKELQKSFKVVNKEIPIDLIPIHIKRGDIKQ